MTLLDKLRSIDKPPKPAPQPVCSGTDCYIRTELRESDEFPHIDCLTYDALMLMQSQPIPQPLDQSRILYLDTETTGLGTGAGTVAFEVGTGRLMKDGFHITQYVLRDYPEEPYLLSHIEEELKHSDMICTFNGRTFDIPLLRTRFLMNRMNPGCLDLPHVDLLPLARRIWKLRLKSCTLQHLETDILHVPRHGDLPGSEAPQRFFSYLKTGEFTLLDDVLIHNAQDVASMCSLLSHMALLYHQPELHEAPEDLFSMASALEKEKHIREAQSVYRLVPSGRLHASSQLRLAATHRRAGEKSTAVKVYERMLSLHEGGVVPYIELAKYYEHTAKDPGKALELTRAALLLLAEPALGDDTAVQQTRFELQYRYDRLLRKRSGKVRD